MADSSSPASWLTEQSLSARSLAPPPEVIASLGCLRSLAASTGDPEGSPPALITPFWHQQLPGFLGVPHLGWPEEGTVGDPPSWMTEPEVNSQAQCLGQPGSVPWRQAGPCLLPTLISGSRQKPSRLADLRAPWLPVASSLDSNSEDRVKTSRAVLPGRKREHREIGPPGGLL